MLVTASGSSGILPVPFPARLMITTLKSFWFKKLGSFNWALVTREKELAPKASVRANGIPFWLPPGTPFVVSPSSQTAIVGAAEVGDGGTRRAHVSAQSAAYLKRTIKLLSLFYPADRASFQPLRGVQELGLHTRHTIFSYLPKGPDRSVRRADINLRSSAR